MPLSEKKTMRPRETVVEDQRKAEKPTVKMKWIVVTEHGKRQLRMVWRVVCATHGVAHNAAA
jgi:hypothetical protein